MSTLTVTLSLDAMSPSTMVILSRMATIRWKVGERRRLAFLASTMYAIHRQKIGMKRTQLYLDEEMARTLAALSRQKGTTVSDLVRESVRDKYMSRKEMDKVSLARQLSGIWRNRKDLRDIEGTIRRLRRGTRLRRFGLA